MEHQAWNLIDEASTGVAVLHSHLHAAAADLVRRSRAAQGLPAIEAEPRTLDRVARLLAAAPDQGHASRVKANGRLADRRDDHALEQGAA